MPFNDLREFIDAARKLGQVKEIHGAHWNLEIGALTEMFAFKEPSPLVLFDQIPGPRAELSRRGEFDQYSGALGPHGRHAGRCRAHRTDRPMERTAQGRQADSAAGRHQRSDSRKRQEPAPTST